MIWNPQLFEMNQIDSIATDLERSPLKEIKACLAHSILGLCAEPGSTGATCDRGPVTTICQVGTALRSPSLLVNAAKLPLSQSQITDLDIKGSLSHYQ